MKIYILPVSIMLVLTFFSGCVEDKDVDSPSVLDDQNPTDEIIESVNYMEFSGRSYSNDTAICYTNTCVGRMNWGFPDRFIVTDDTTYGFVTVQWDSTTSSELQHLDIFIFSGSYPDNYKIVARDQGKSPLTLAFIEDDLIGHISGNRTSLGVGFSADGPAKITHEQIIYWDVVILFS